MPHPERLQKRTRGFARMGGLVGDGLLRWAKDEGRRFAERSEEWFGEYDALLTPVATRPPVLAGNWQRRPALLTLLGMTSTYPFNVAWNVTGQPSAAIPAGMSADGLPIGLQLVGRRDGEGTLLSLSAQLEAELRWPERRPQL
jgi:amidase